MSSQSSAFETVTPLQIEGKGDGACPQNNPIYPPDFVGAYTRNKPLPPKGIEKRKAYIVGSGIAGLAAAFYLIRDGHMPGPNITILDADPVAGGSLDGTGDAEIGYIMRGGRELCWTHENFWDVFYDVPASGLPEGYSVLDDFRLLSDSDPNYSKARLMHRQGQIMDFSTFGLTASQQWELTRLLFMRKEERDDVTIEQYFSKGFLETNFWMLWRTMFASLIGRSGSSTFRLSTTGVLMSLAGSRFFQNWHSLREMKLYVHRFLDMIDGPHDLSAGQARGYRHRDYRLDDRRGASLLAGFRRRKGTSVVPAGMKMLPGKWCRCSPEVRSCGHVG